MTNIIGYIKKWITFGCVILFSTLAIEAKSESVLSGNKFGSARGVVWTGTVANGNWTTTLRNAGSKYHDLSQYWGGGLSATYPNAYWGEVDGRKGLVLAPGVLLEFSGISVFSMTNGGSYPAAPINVIYDWGKDPTASNNSDYSIKYNEGRWDTLERSTLTKFWHNSSSDATIDFIRSNRITPRLYLSSSLQAGKYEFLGYVEIVDYSQSSNEYTRIISNISFTTSYLECTISAPPTVDFGQANLNGIPKDGLLASKVQGIDISCNSDDQSSIANQMKISFNGDFQGTNWGRLSVKNSTGATMGYIRGRYLESTGLCAAHSEEVGFNGTSAIKEINNVGVGIRHVPITWSLCSNNSGLLGDGSAQATVNINWD